MSEESCKNTDIGLCLADVSSTLKHCAEFISKHSNGSVTGGGPLLLMIESALRDVKTMQDASRSAEHALTTIKEMEG